MVQRSMVYSPQIGENVVVYVGFIVVHHSFIFEDEPFGYVRLQDIFLIASKE